MAVLRRCFGSLSWHFFDDIGSVSCKLHHKLASILPSFLFDSLGLPINAKKHIPWAQLVPHLGVLVDFRLAHVDIVYLRPKEGRIEGITKKVGEALLSKGKSLPSGDAASLQGEITYSYAPASTK